MSEELRSQWEGIQTKLRQQLIEVDDVPWSLDATQSNGLRLVGGVDISFMECSNTAVACLVVMSYPDLQVVYEDYEQTELTVPYLAGFLGFREADLFLGLIQRVQKTEFNPEVILVDGNGILHPRRFGSACHLGVISGYPTIGVAKNLYCIDGLNERTVTENVRRKIDDHAQNNSLHQNRGGDTLELRGRQGTLLGVALFSHGIQQTRNAIYISIGLQTSISLIKYCSLYRIPEPIRQADLRSRLYVRSMM